MDWHVQERFKSTALVVIRCNRRYCFFYWTWKTHIALKRIWIRFCSINGNIHGRIWHKMQNEQMVFLCNSGRLRVGLALINYQFGRCPDADMVPWSVFRRAQGHATVWIVVFCILFETFVCYNICICLLFTLGKKYIRSYLVLPKQNRCGKKKLQWMMSLLKYLVLQSNKNVHFQSAPNRNQDDSSRRFEWFLQFFLPIIFVITSSILIVYNHMAFIPMKHGFFLPIYYVACMAGM